VDLRIALAKARKDGKITCDRLEFYEKRADILEEFREPDQPIGYEYGRVVAWRGDKWAFVDIARQLVEHASSLGLVAGVICEDLNAELDRFAA